MFNLLKKNVLFGISFLLFAIAPTVQAEVKLAKIFSDHMMIQRGKPINVWGVALPNSKIKITLDSKTIEVTADSDGRWSGQLEAIEKGENLELVVIEKNTITIKDIIVGDIWLCSGQSNMEFKLNMMGTLVRDEIIASDFPKIRLFLMRGISTPYPQENIDGGPWSVCTPKSAPNITAIGFFFAREVFSKTQIPIGILESDLGGTPIEPWLAMEGIKKVPELKSAVDKMEKEHQAWLNLVPKLADDAEKWANSTREALKAGLPIPIAPALPGPPGTNMRDYYCNLYNGKIFPLIRFPIKGVLWYQGEANTGSGDVYAGCMRALITGWREVWQIGDFPFLFVQIANVGVPSELPAGGAGARPFIRSAQLESLKIPNTGMASAIDLGESEIHPKDKLNVGLRLARWALRDYGDKDLVVSGPLFKEIKIDGSTIQISFDHVGSGLMIGKKPTIKESNWRDPAVEDKDGKLQKFAIAGADKVWYWADAVIDGDMVKVSSPKVPAPVAVRYAFSQNPLGANLYNKEGLPASSFRTDNW